jgi:integrase
MHTRDYDATVSSGRGQRGTLVQLPDGRWRARYREDGRGGARPQRTFPTKRAAQAWLRDRLDEVEQIREGDTRPTNLRRHSALTTLQAVERWLATVDVAPPTKVRLEQQLRVFTRTFGDRPLQSLERDELLAWRLSPTEGWRADVFRETKRFLRDAVENESLRSSPAATIKNPNRRRPEATPIPWAHVLALSEEIDRHFAHVPVLAAGTGLRPEEWLALERRDVDLAGRVLYVRRVWSSGRLVELGPDGSKTSAQRRRVPLRGIVVELLSEFPPRIDTPLIVPPTRRTQSGYMTLSSFRDRFWRDAYSAAGLPYQRPYDLRHTYASESIAAGVNLFDLSRFMGTSVVEIDRTYGHLVSDSEERNRDALDAYDAARPSAKKAALGR